jgi:hypothetical protein
MTMTGNEFATVLRNALRGFHAEAAKFWQSHRPEPLAGSQAATEWTTYARPDSPRTVAAITSVLMESIGEHLTAFVKTITEPVEPIACWTCVRSMLESSSIAAWLVEPGIGAQTRVGRSFAIRYEGMDQQVKLARAMGWPAAEVQKIEDHIDDVEQVALGLGFPPLKNKNGERIGIAQRMPSATEMIKTMLDEELAYRLLSTVAYRHFWAINRLGFKAVVPTAPPTTAVPTTALATELSLDSRGRPVKQFPYLDGAVPPRRAGRQRLVAGVRLAQ